MERICVRYGASFFDDAPIALVEQGAFKATALKYSTGVCGVKLENGCCSMVLLPYHGHQLWFAEFNGKNLTQKSIFDVPQMTKKFGDNYGGLLLHCGLSAMGNPGPEDSHPMHGELPFATYTDNYVALDEDENGRYLAAGGTFHYRNSQEFDYLYKPEVRIYEGSTVARMFITVDNLRCHDMKYMYMCHMNWRAVDGSRVLATVPCDAEHMIVDPTDLGDDSPRAKAVMDFSKQLIANPALAQKLDEKTQCYDPEICTDMRVIGDEHNWAHALQVMPDGDACYVGFRRDELPNALRWVCRTGDEDGIGIALPNTGNHKGYTWNKKHGFLRTIPAHGSISMRFNFGYLAPAEAKKMEQHIADVLKAYESKQ